MLNDISNKSNSGHHFSKVIKTGKFTRKIKIFEIIIIIKV
jgi:hypothetical protein